MFYSAAVSAYDSPAHEESDGDAIGQDVAAVMRWHGSAVVLTVSGEIDMVTAPRFEEALTAALAERPTMVVVDLEKVEFFGSAGLTALIGVHQQAGENAAVRVVATNRATVRPLEVTGVDRTVPIYSSVESAVAGD